LLLKEVHAVWFSVGTITEVEQLFVTFVHVGDGEENAVGVTFFVELAPTTAQVAGLSVSQVAKAGNDHAMIVRVARSGNIFMEDSLSSRSRRQRRPI
jgi:hypothetical protein